MKFDLVSDLHDDHWDQGRLDWAALKIADGAIVAGDISDDPEETVAELARMAQVYKTVLFVDDNHEHQRSFPDIDSPVELLSERLKAIPNVHYLTDGPWVGDGVGVVGRNGWWDYRIAEPRVAA